MSEEFLKPRRIRMPTCVVEYRYRNGNIHVWSVRCAIGDERFGGQLFFGGGGYLVAQWCTSLRIRWHQRATTQSVDTADTDTDADADADAGAGAAGSIRHRVALQGLEQQGHTGFFAHCLDVVVGWVPQVRNRERRAGKEVGGLIRTTEKAHLFRGGRPGGWVGGWGVVGVRRVVVED